MPFDPDAYLAKKDAGPAFDPDAYLKGGDVDENSYFRRVGAMPKKSFTPGDAIGTKYEDGTEYVGDNPRLGTPMLRKPMGEQYADASRTILPVAAALTGPAAPYLVPAAAATGEALAQEIEGGKVGSPGRVAAAGIVSAVPGASSVMGNLVRQGAGNVAGATAEALIDKGRLPDRQELMGSVNAAMLGTVLDKAMRTLPGGVERAYGSNQLEQAERDSLAAGMKRGMKINPVEVDNTWLNRLKSGIAGPEALKAQLRLDNRMTANRAIKEQMGIPATESITDTALKQRIADASLPQGEIRQLGQGFSDALDQVQRAREEASLAWQAHKQDFRKVNAEEVKAAQKAADDAETQLELMVSQVDPDLMARYRAGRMAAAETYTVKDALNPASGNIDTGELADRVRNRLPMRGAMRDIGSFGATETGARYIGQSPNPAGSTALRTTGAMVAAADALPDVGAAAKSGGAWLVNDPMRRYLAGDSAQAGALEALIGKEITARRLDALRRALAPLTLAEAIDQQKKQKASK